LNANVLYVAAEAVPLVKTGGLGDVLGGLSGCLRRQGVDVTLLLPGYPAAIAGALGVRSIGALGLHEAHPRLELAPGHSPMRLLVGRMPDTGVQVALLDCPSLYDRPGSPYTDNAGREYPDNPQRFAALAHAATAIAAGRTALPAPQLVHAHDWHAGLTPLLMRAAGLATPCAFTIHNLAFQGLYPLGVAPSLGVPPAWLGPEGIEFWGQMSFMKAGIRYASRVTTVSRAYAAEVLTPRFGHGLDGLLASLPDGVHAVPNGIDASQWDPLHDPLLPAPYAAGSLAGKRACKAALQARFGLPPEPDKPLVAIGNRLTHQKMADLAVPAIEATLAAHRAVQFAVLGCGDADIEAAFVALAARYPRRVAVSIGYREETAHLLHAGADLLLHGSRFEPFGLAPVYAMRYGALPVVSRVGGMVDTVRDAGRGHVPAPGATGFVFDGETPADVSAALRRALHWFGDPHAWAAMQRNGMTARWGWDDRAHEYLAMYRDLAPSLVPQLETVAAEAAAPVPERGRRIPACTPAPDVPATILPTAAA